MNLYHVQWEVEIGADTPREAAETAREWLLDPGAECVVFTVKECGTDEAAVLVDLLEDEMNEIEEIAKYRTPDGEEFLTMKEAKKHLDWLIAVEALEARLRIEAPGVRECYARELAEWLANNYEITVKR